MEEMKETRPSNKRNMKYDNPELVRKIVELRANDMSYDDIVFEVEDEYPTITRQKVTELFKKGVARSIVVEKRAGKKFDDFSNEMNKMYKRAVLLMENYLDALSTINDELNEMKSNGMLDNLATQKQIIKTIPEATKLWKELREYMKFHLEQQDKIVETSKAEVWSFQDFVDKSKEVIELLESEGYTIIKPELN